MLKPDPLTTQQRQLVNKRLTLNLLIQGAATHAFWTAHHVVAEELNELNCDLIPLYEKMLLCANLGYWIGSIPIIMGNAMRFWKHTAKGKTGHPFQRHPFFHELGLGIAKESRAELFRNCKQAGISTWGMSNEIFGTIKYLKAMKQEAGLLPELEQLAIATCHEIYDIPKTLLNAEITSSPKWGDIRTPKTRRGKMIMPLMVGWGGVRRDRDRLVVEAKASIWPLLVHELIKGTVELICLHGLGDLGEEEYSIVMDHTEHIEYEFPMIQIGRMVFQRFLAARPRNVSLAECIKHVASFEPEVLEQFMFALFQSPNRATDQLLAAASAT